MRKWGSIFLALVLIAAAASAMPFERNDVAQLVPVEALVISAEDGELMLNGGACKGRGKTWEDAWKDLKESAEGTVFLSTTEYVVLTGGAAKMLQNVAWNTELRPAAELYAGLGQTLDPENIAKYLSAHHGGMPLHQVRAALLENRTVSLPILAETEGGLRLHGTDDP